MENEIKNKVIWILLGIIFLIVILVALLLNSDNNKKLLGKNIMDGLYVYNLKENDYVQNIHIEKNYIYYLTNKDKTYKLYKKSIYSNKKQEVGTIESDMCLLNNDYLSCINGEVTTIYDNKLREIYQSREQFNIIPYLNSFLIIKDKEIYLNDKKIRTIKDDYERFDIVDYYVCHDNTYIEFISISDIYLYNVKDDSYDKLEFNDMHFYDKGIYSVNKDKIIIKDLDNNKIREYNNFQKNDNYNLNAVKDNLFLYMDNGFLKINNMETNKLKYLDYKFTYSFDKMVLSDNYIYLICMGDNPMVYVVKMDEINSSEYTYDEYEEMLKHRISKRIGEIEDKYPSVNIIYDIKAIDGYETWNEQLVNELQYELIADALDGIENVLDKLGRNFISLFKHDDYEGLRIIIANKIIPDKKSNVKDLVGLFFDNYTNYNIIVANDEISYEKNFCHEMMHAIDDHALNHRYGIDDHWYDYNPQGFDYNIKHYQDNNLLYTIYSYDENEIYFVDAYSKLNQSEDRARIFENVCYINGENIIKQYPNLLKKAEYIKNELLKNYPSLINSKIFDSIK